MLRRSILVQCMKCSLGSWSYHRILRAAASFGLSVFLILFDSIFFFAVVIFFTSVVEVVVRLRFDEPFQLLVRTGVGNRTRTPFVGMQKQIAFAIRQSVEYDEI